MGDTVYTHFLWVWTGSSLAIVSCGAITFRKLLASGAYSNTFRWTRARKTDQIQILAHCLKGRGFFFVVFLFCFFIKILKIKRSSWEYLLYRQVLCCIVEITQHSQRKPFHSIPLSYFRMSAQSCSDAKFVPARDFSDCIYSSKCHVGTWTRLRIFSVCTGGVHTTIKTVFSTSNIAKGHNAFTLMVNRSSFVCGLAGALASNPVDVVRTRMMNQRGGALYQGTLDCLLQVSQNPWNVLRFCCPLGKELLHRFLNQVFSSCKHRHSLEKEGTWTALSLWRYFSSHPRCFFSPKNKCNRCFKGRLIFPSAVIIRCWPSRPFIHAHIWKFRISMKANLE